MSGTFQLDGQDFMALNGGPMYTFTPAISFMVDCKTQEEVDHFWEKLSEGGSRTSADGSRTSSVCSGRSSLPFWA